MFKQIVLANDRYQKGETHIILKQLCHVFHVSWYETLALLILMERVVQQRQNRCSNSKPDEQKHPKMTSWERTAKQALR